MNDFKPIDRSHLRLILGKKYYTFMRYGEWIFGKKHFAGKSNASGIEHLIFSHSTPLYRSLKNVDMWLQHNKVENLKIASAKISGVVIRPGETFSYWKMIGKPTHGKGYKDGMILHYGNYKYGPGGGLCQLSNLIYWMALHTPLTVTERHRHSYDVFPDSSRTQPFGSGATCVYNYRDLQLLNETQANYKIDLWLDDSHLYGCIESDSKRVYEYEVYEAAHEILPQYWGGYIRHNAIRRRVYNENRFLIQDQAICENHALMMYDPLIESGSVI